jgi:hypothetical protein
MRLELVPAEPQHVDAIGQICFEAFKEVQEGAVFRQIFPLPKSQDKFSACWCSAMTFMV